MKYLSLFLLALFTPALFAQSVNLVDLQQPAAAPVQPGATDHEVLQFRLYKNAGSAASDFTEIKVELIGTAGGSDWDTIRLYYDADGSRTVNTGDQQLASTTGTVTGKAVLSGFTEPIQDDFFNGRDYLVVVDVNSAATVDNTFVFQAAAADVTVSAGTVSAPFGSIVSNTHTIRTDNGCEMDVFEGTNAIPSSTTSSYDVGYVDAAGGSRTFTVMNTGTGQLDITGNPRVAISNQNNCTAAVGGNNLSATIAAASQDTFTIDIDPTNLATFAFRMTIENSDFDEFPYVIIITGTAVPQPDIEIEYNSSVVDSGDSISVGSYTAGVAATLDFDIYNTGNATLNLNGSPLVDFPTEQNVSCSLQTAPGNTVAAAGGPNSFTVEFTPVGSGNWTFVLWVESDDPDENPYSIQVDGTAPAVTPSKLSMYREPANATATVIFGTLPIVAITNAIGAVDTSDNSTSVEVTLNATNGASLSGTTTRTSSGGYVSYTDLKIDKAGTGYTLTFTDTGGTFGSVTSAPFDVAAAPPKPKDDSGGGDDDDGGCSTHAPGTPWMLIWAALAVMLVGIRTLRGISQKS